MLLYRAFLPKAFRVFCLSLIALLFTLKGFGQQGRSVVDFDKGWHFHLGDVSDGEKTSLADAAWRGGIGWYRKTFIVPAASKNKLIYIDFDGVYQKSTVWINGHKLGFRPNG